MRTPPDSSSASTADDSPETVRWPGLFTSPETRTLIYRRTVATDTVASVASIGPPHRRLQILAKAAETSADRGDVA